MHINSLKPSRHGLIGALAARLERRLSFGLSMNDGDLYVSIGTDTLTGGVVRHRLGTP